MEGFFMRWDIGIDLGTQSVRMAELKLGPVLAVPAADGPVSRG